MASKGNKGASVNDIAYVTKFCKDNGIEKILLIDLTKDYCPEAYKLRNEFFP